MATGNQYTAAVKGGFWPSAGVASLSNTSGRGANRRRAALALSRTGTLALREAMTTLNGVVAGSAASATRTRIAAAQELGGKRTIETETQLSRNTAASDVTEIAADVLTYSSTQAFPTNLNGNPLGAPGL